MHFKIERGYGIFVYNGKMLWLLTMYKAKFKGETDENYKKKIYKTYGIVFVIIGIIILVISFMLYINGIETTKNNNLY